ncbi:MAG: hypothetical protein RML46_10650 [Anaerolineae bacterium]|nr:hypothetical protein [Anaerolineae bacterium]
MRGNLQITIATPILIALLLFLSLLWLSEDNLAEAWNRPSSQESKAFPQSGPYPTSILPQPDARNMERVAQLGGPVLKAVVSGTYAYVGMGPRLIVLNVSDPARPVLLGQSDVLPGIVQDVAVAGNYVYVIGNEYRARLWILSIASPNRPTVVNSVDFQADAKRMAISGNRAYVTVAGKGLQILDISNPASPQFLGQFPSGSGFVAVSGNYAYVLSPRLYIVDVTNPLSPTQVGIYTYTMPAGGPLSGIAVSGNYAYIAKGNDDLEIVNISDPSRPSPVMTFTVNAFGLALSGNYAYVADTHALRVLDISNPSNPQVIGFCHLPWGIGGAVALAGDYAYVANDDGGLRIVRVADPRNPTEVARFFVLGYVRGLAKKDRVLYASGFLTHTRILDISDPSRPTPVGFYPAFTGKAFRVEGNHLYLGTDRLLILDVSDPARPDLLGQTKATTSTVTGIAVAGNYAYLAIQFYGLCIVDVSNPSSPMQKGCYQNPSVRAVAVDGNYAYVGGSNLLAVVDISNPDVPTLRSEYKPFSDWIGGIAVSGDYLYTTAMYRFRTFRRQDPLTPTLLSTYNLPGGGDALVLRGNLAYVADNDKGVRVLDLSDPARPVEVGFYDTPGHTFHLDVSGDYIYAADYAGGLTILRFVPPLTAVIPPTGGSLTSPNDRTTLTFPPGAFTDTVVITYTARSPQGVPPPGDRVGIGRFFEVTAVYSATGQPARLAPGMTFTMTVGYTDAERGPAIEDTLALYWWENGQWRREETSWVDPAQNIVAARPNHLSLWGVLGQTHRVFLPIVLRNR